MLIKNTTSIDYELVKEILTFVKPPKVTKIDVMIKNGTTLAGKAYIKGSKFHATSKPFIVCRIPAKNFPCWLYPYQYGQLKGKRYWLKDRTEALVYIAAHEFRHHWQAKATNKRGYIWGARGRYSEIDTESYAIRMIRAWRIKEYLSSFRFKGNLPLPL